MKAWERWTLRVGYATATATGLGYGYLKYFSQVDGEFGPVPHCFQGPLQHVHILAAPIMVFAFGIAVRGHAVGMLKHHVQRGRKTGIALLAVGGLMIFGGYLIQIVTGHLARNAAAWIHGLASALFVLIYIAHWLKPTSALKRVRQVGVEGERLGSN